jgi:hypothetical protein
MRLIKATTLALIGSLALAGCTSGESDSEATPSPFTDQATNTAAQGSDESTEAELPSESDDRETTDEANESQELEAEENASPLSDEEIILSALMGPDGEYAALASYQAVLDEYGQVEPYATILAAEARHADALIRQLERLGVEVPENPYLGQIEAPADLQTAAEAWAEGEILNVELYDYLLTQTDDSQLTKVLNNLRSASLDSHLPAFQAAAENGGTLDEMNSGRSD